MRGVGGEGRFTFPDLRHKGARLSETCGEERRKGGKERPEQGLRRPDAEKKTKEGGHGRRLRSSIGAARTRCIVRAMDALSS